MWNPRVFADDARGWQCPFVLCLHPQGCLRRGVLLKSGPGNRVLELRRDSRVTTEISVFLLCWPWEAQSSPRVARESWGWRSSAGRLSGTVSPFRAEQGTSLETPWRARASSCHILEFPAIKWMNIHTDNYKRPQVSVHQVSHPITCRGKMCFVEIFVFPNCEYRVLERDTHAD